MPERAARRSSSSIPSQISPRRRARPERLDRLGSVPLAISAQTVDANLPEVRGRSLKLSGPALADIYSAKIRQWDDGPIAELNPGVHLPPHAIVPVRRADSSGDTFIFT